MTLVRLGLVALLISASVLIEPRAAKADGMGYDVGALLGLAIPSSEGANSRFGWGLEGEYRILPAISGGVYFFTSKQDISIPAAGGTPAVTSSNRISMYGLQAGYFFPGVNGLSGGGRVGLSHSSTEVNAAAGPSSTDFEIGPYAAFDVHVAPQISVGGDASILFVTASSGYNVINLLGTVKFFF
jgi:hypothetical protein